MSTSQAKDVIGYWPRLTWFYGIPPSEIEGMPYAVIRLYLEAIPSFQAETQLLALEAVSFPYYEEKDRERTHRDYVRALEVEKPKDNKGRATLPDAMALGGMGIAVKRKVKKAQEVASADA